MEYLRQIEKDIQHQWYEQKIYEIDAQPKNIKNTEEKYFATFPFPYMNGRLHLGHTFSLSKCEVKIASMFYLKSKTLEILIIRDVLNIKFNV